MTTFHPSGVTPEDDACDLREPAIGRLRKKRDLQAHVSETAIRREMQRLDRQ